MIKTGAKGHPHARLAAAMAAVNQVVLGKPSQVEMAFACLLARGHLLLEDVPGVGKTTLARALAASLGLDFARIQFTSDLLPSDILGVSIYERATGAFKFHPGPIHTQLLLADEINRGTPKTQSALLEAMAEGQATTDGHTFSLPQPFFVIATQNPLDMAGTYPLPDSELDRFMLCISMGYPDHTAERHLLRGLQGPAPTPLLDAATIAGLRTEAAAITTSDALLDYVQALLAASRSHPDIRTGLSPRAGLALLAAARALALIRARAYVIPEDIQALFVAAAAHRLHPGGQARRGALADDLLAHVQVP